MDQQHARPLFWKSPFGVLALLPYAFLAACPLMHMFVHRGHGHGGHPHGGSRDADGSRGG